jgi:hypothetical protein
MPMRSSRQSGLKYTAAPNPRSCWAREGSTKYSPRENGNRHGSLMGPCSELSQQCKAINEWHSQI